MNLPRIQICTKFISPPLNFIAPTQLPMLGRDVLNYANAQISVIFPLYTVGGKNFVS